MSDAEKQTAPEARTIGDKPVEAVVSAAYRAALRHSTRVRILKRMIPLTALVATASITIYSLVDPLQSIGGLTLGSAGLSGTRITMDAPRLSGYRDGTQPYDMTAASASQDIKNPSIIELNDITSHVQMSNGSKAMITAFTGVYDSQSEFMKLKGDVRVQTDSGYDARLASASVNFKDGRVISNEPVTVKISEGTISADSLDISDSGKHIVFEGRVRTILDGSKSEAQSQNTGTEHARSKSGVGSHSEVLPAEVLPDNNAHHFDAGFVRPQPTRSKGI